MIHSGTMDNRCASQPDGVSFTVPTYPACAARSVPALHQRAVAYRPATAIRTRDVR